MGTSLLFRRVIGPLAALVVMGISCGGSPPKPAQSASNGQACNSISWLREFVGTGDLSVYAIATTQDGGVVVVAPGYRKVAVRGDGQTLGTVDIEGTQEGLVFKLRADGGVSWSRRVGAAGSRVELGAVTVSADGTVVVAGSYDGAPMLKGDGSAPSVPLTPVPKQGSNATRRLFVAWYASDGTPKRAITSNEASDTRSVAALVAAGNDVVVAGRFNGELTFGAGAHGAKLTPKGYEDAFVARFDPAGELVWARRMGGSGGDSATALAVGPHGSLFVAGQFRKRDPSDTAGMTLGDGADTLLPVGGTQDAFLLELGGDGRLAWWEAIGGDEGHELWAGDEVRGIAPTADGDALIVGNASFPLRIGLASPAIAPGERDIPAGYHHVPFLARVARGGQARWTVPLGDGSVRGLAALPDGDIAISAEGSDDMTWLFGPKQVNLTSGGLDDMLLARHAPDGTLRWVARFGGDTTEWGSAVAADERGALFAAGRFHSEFLLERVGCAPLPVHGTTRPHLNSFVLRVPPGANPSDPDREPRLAARAAKALALRRRGGEALASGDFAKACPAFKAVTELLPLEPAAWLDLGACLKSIDPDAAVAAELEVLQVATRYEDVILSEHEAARRKAYLALAELGQSVLLPTGGCEELAAARGCKRSLWACVGESAATQATAARIGLSQEHASVDDTELMPAAPSLGRWGYATEETFGEFHHYFQRADSMDVLLSADDVECKVVTADACLGLIGMVCEGGADEAGHATKTVDEFYLWRPDQQAAPNPDQL